MLKNKLKATKKFIRKMKNWKFFRKKKIINNIKNKLKKINGIKILQIKKKKVQIKRKKEQKKFHYLIMILILRMAV